MVRLNKVRIQQSSGVVEPHSYLLTPPSADQLLYKIISTENFIKSIEGKYLHFTRVDCFEDQFDGKQLLKDQPGNSSSRFEKRPDYSASDCYDTFRSRAYAYCLSTEETEYIWENYGNNGMKGKICIVFEFGKLRQILNDVLDNGKIKYNGKSCCKMFSINYGLVEYVDFAQHNLNSSKLPNPIEYIYIKDRAFERESEARISLSTIGFGIINVGGTEMQFPENMQVDFDFIAAEEIGAIKHIKYSRDCDLKYLYSELKKLGISPRAG